MMQVQPYLLFEGRCEEAIEFYKRAVGAEVEMVMRYKDNPEPPRDPAMVPPNSADKVMHAAFHIGSTSILASDGRCSGTAPFEGFGLALYAEDDAGAERLFDALGNGGQVRQPMVTTFFSSRFGMVADRFGVLWMVLVETTR